MATRREVLGQLALGLGVLSCRSVFAQPAEAAAYVGVETSNLGNISRASFFSETGARLGGVQLDYRAHGLAEHDDLLIVFPRRPGNKFSIVSKATLEVKAVITAPEGRHFFGHGAFTPDGVHLIVTENDLDTLEGGLGVYDMRGGGQRLGSVVLPGPGPHEIVCMPGQDRFLVAIGGLETHPDYGRTPFNLSSFTSEVVAYDFASGSIERLGLWGGTEGISLRHLAQDDAGRVYIGGQIKTPDRLVEGASVLWLVENGAARPLDQGALMNGYVSSVAARGARALVSSKESGLCLELDGASVVAEQALTGASGVAFTNRGPVLSGFSLLRMAGGDAAVLEGHEFDNHGLRLG